MTPSLFEAGYGAGMNADLALSPFEMSPYYMDYKVGYVIGLAYMESVRRANPYAGASEAGDMGVKYRIPYELLEPHFDEPSDTQILGFLRMAYGLDEDDDEDYEYSVTD